MTVPPAIPFAVSGLVLVWATASAVMAFTGGIRSGLHEAAPPKKDGSAE